MSSREGAAPASGSWAAALLLGSAVCVGCVLSLGFATLGMLGFASVPAWLFGGTPTGYALSGVLLLGFLGLLVRGIRRNRVAVSAGQPPNPYWVFHGPRALASLVVGFTMVSTVALVAQLGVETLTPFTYTIHWTQSVPFLTLAFAWILHGEWNRRVLERAASGAQSTQI